MTLPVSTVVRPAALDGQSNGKLDPDVLRSSPGEAMGPSVVLVMPADRAWRAMAAAAHAAGHVLKSVSSYRNYETQERIFRERYRTYDTGSGERKWWLSQWWWRLPNVAAAAVPGTSNHGWGLAVDIGEERDGDSGVESIDDNTVQWLIDHAHLYGFSAEIQSEKWHWRYFAGDAIPQAVLAYEHVQPLEEDPVVIKRKQNVKHAIAVIDGNWYMSEDGGIDSAAAIVVDESAWRGLTAGRKIVKV